MFEKLFIVKFDIKKEKNSDRTLTNDQVSSNNFMFHPSDAGQGKIDVMIK